MPRVRAKATDSMALEEKAEEMSELDERLERLERRVEELADVVEGLMDEGEETTVTPFEVEEINGKLLRREDVEKVVDEWRKSYIIH